MSCQLYHNYHCIAHSTEIKLVNLLILFITHRETDNVGVKNFFSQSCGLCYFPEGEARVLKAIFRPTEHTLLDTNGEFRDLKMGEVSLDIIYKNLISLCAYVVRKTEPG